MTLIRVIAVFYGIAIVSIAVAMVIRDERKARKEGDSDRA